TRVTTITRIDVLASLPSVGVGNPCERSGASERTLSLFLHVASPPPPPSPSHAHGPFALFLVLRLASSSLGHPSLPSSPSSGSGRDASLSLSPRLLLMRRFVSVLRLLVALFW